MCIIVKTSVRLFLKLFKNLIGWVLDLINPDEGFQMGSILCGNSMPIHCLGKDSKTTSRIK